MDHADREPLCTFNDLETEPWVHPDISVFRLWNSFGWVSVVFSILSGVIACYMFYSRVKWKPYLLKYDHHYRLRFSLSLILILNRALNVSSFILSHQITVNAIRMMCTMEIFAKLGHSYPLAFHQVLYKHKKDLDTAVSWIYSSFLCTSYIMLTLMLFLMMDRYRRVHMVLQGSFMHKALNAMTVLYIIALMFICVAYIFDNVSNRPEELNQVAVWMIKYKSVFEVVAIPSGMLFYYYFCISLIVNALRGVDLSFTSVYTALRQVYFNYKPKRTLQQYQVGSSSSFKSYALTESTPEPDVIAETDPGTSQHGLSGPYSTHLDNMSIDNEAISIQHQKIASAVKMLFYVLIILLVDIFMLLSLILTVIQVFQPDAQVNTSNLGLFVTSWVVVHVYLMYELLDMFLDDLKKAKAKVRQKSASPSGLKDKMKQWQPQWPIKPLRILKESDITQDKQEPIKGKSIQLLPKVKEPALDSVSCTFTQHLSEESVITRH